MSKYQSFIRKDERPQLYEAHAGHTSTVYGTFSSKEGGSDGKEGGSDGQECAMHAEDHFRSFCLKAA